MKIRFLCGCETGNIEGRENLLTMDAVTIDDEGMLTCTYHGARRYGWRSIPNSENHPGPKFPYLGMTPAQIEGRIVFRDPFPMHRPLNIVFTNVPDRRDNRDPELVQYPNRDEMKEWDNSEGKGLELLKRNREILH